jgi:hypothetical protein
LRLKCGGMHAAWLFDGRVAWLVGAWLHFFVAFPPKCSGGMLRVCRERVAGHFVNFYFVGVLVRFGVLTLWILILGHWNNSRVSACRNNRMLIHKLRLESVNGASECSHSCRTRNHVGCIMILCYFSLWGGCTSRRLHQDHFWSIARPHLISNHSWFVHQSSPAVIDRYI